MTRTTSRRPASWPVIAAVILAKSLVVSAQENQEKTTVLLKPGQNLQAIVEDAPEGTVFLFEPGLYRMQTIYPKSRQEFLGQEGVILNGAMELKSWSKASGLWRSEDLPPSLPFHGRCEAGRPLCTIREDLFFNGRLYQRVGSFEELGPGRWYQEGRRAYLSDDPIGQSVELGVTPRAFGGEAHDVVLKDLIVEKYASDSQQGAIFADNGYGWRISNVIARWNHGAGLSFGSNTRVTGGAFSHNGQLGMAGIGENSRIEGVEIAFNNYAGYDARWEAGGTKFWETRGLTVLDSCIHHNGGPGLWTDNDNIHVTYQGNKVFLNADDGIKHEISYDAIIRDNIVARNGTSAFDDWLWGAQILIQNSSNVKVYGNIVEVSDEFGNGIGVIHQDRGSGIYGAWIAANNVVHQNTIIHLGRRGRNGVVTDTGDSDFWATANNSFDDNSYVVADRDGAYWTAKGGEEPWGNLRDMGLERSGKLSEERRAPMTLSCGLE